MSTTITIDRSKLYGVLHEPSGRRIVRQVRVLKVGIGVPTGPDVHVWIDQNQQWCVEVGTYMNVLIRIFLQEPERKPTS